MGRSWKLESHTSDRWALCTSLVNWCKICACAGKTWETPLKSQSQGRLENWLNFECAPQHTYKSLGSGWNPYRLKVVFVFFFRFYLFIFRRGEEKEKERERNINVWLPFACPVLGTWLATQTCSLTGNWTGNRLVCRPHSIHWATPARVVEGFLVQPLLNHWPLSYAYKGASP